MVLAMAIRRLVCVPAVTLSSHDPLSTSEQRLRAPSSQNLCVIRRSAAQRALLTSLLIRRLFELSLDRNWLFTYRLRCDKIPWFSVFYFTFATLSAQATAMLRLVAASSLFHVDRSSRTGYMLSRGTVGGLPPVILL